MIKMDRIRSSNCSTPTIENPKPVLSSRNIENQNGWDFPYRFRARGGWAVAQAQQPTKVPRIGYLTANSPSAESARTEAFRQGLRELGYVEGKNIVIE